MESVAEVLAAEQKYFDRVADHRERMRRGLLDAPGAAANAGAAVHLRRDAEARLKRIGEPDDAVAVGRMDDEDGDVLYVGYHTIFDDDSEVLVVNWQAPAAARYFTATHADALGLARKRSFDTTGNVVDAFSDTVFRQLAEAVAELEEPGDALLDDLNRDRTGQMQDIVRTIQAAQFDLIRAPLDELLVIQGGPGTGKTAVALHRVSWLLFNHRGTLNPEDVLIVGPTPTFTRYTRTVLPSLGDTSVAQRDIGQLHPPVRRGRPEEAEVARLKGDGRMAGLLRRALYDRVGVPSDQRPIEVQLDGRPVVFTADEINLYVTRSRQTPGTYSQQRQIFRSLMVNSATERARERRLGVRTGLDQLVERIWPSFSAAAVLRDLYHSRGRLIAAAGDELTDRDIALLHRPRSERATGESWSQADLPLLDYLEALIHGIEEQYAHIVVDEAQDLSPMQLRSIAVRSSTGSMTVVGDIAQSTGLWARDNWDDVLEHLQGRLPLRLEELRYGYRVPRQVFEIAAQLLPFAAPAITAPQVVRDGPADPVFRLVDDESRAASAVEAAMAHASHGRSVAIICPAVHRWAVEAELAVRDVAWRAASRNELGQGVNLVSPQEAKGLEFDATVVVEPQDIIAEDARGHRLLYVALTRTTRYLHVVGVLPPADPPARPPSRPLELEPVSRFELTQSLTLPPAIGTASVPAPRAARTDQPASAAAGPAAPVRVEQTISGVVVSAQDAPAPGDHVAPRPAAAGDRVDSGSAAHGGSVESGSVVPASGDSVGSGSTAHGDFGGSGSAAHGDFVGSGSVAHGDSVGLSLAGAARGGHVASGSAALVPEVPLLDGQGESGAAAPVFDELGVAGASPAPGEHVVSHSASPTSFTERNGSGAAVPATMQVLGKHLESGAPSYTSASVLGEQSLSGMPAPGNGERPASDAASPASEPTHSEHIVPGGAVSVSMLDGQERPVSVVPASAPGQQSVSNAATPATMPVPAEHVVPSTAVATPVLGERASSGATPPKSGPVPGEQAELAATSHLSSSAPTRAALPPSAAPAELASASVFRGQPEPGAAVPASAPTPGLLEQASSAVSAAAFLHEAESVTAVPATADRPGPGGVAATAFESQASPTSTSPTALERLGPAVAQPAFVEQVSPVSGVPRFVDSAASDGPAPVSASTPAFVEQSRPSETASAATGWSASALIPAASTAPAPGERVEPSIAAGSASRVYRVPAFVELAPSDDVVAAPEGPTLPEAGPVAVDLTPPVAAAQPSPFLAAPSTAESAHLHTALPSTTTANVVTTSPLSAAPPVAVAFPPVAATTHTVVASSMTPAPVAAAYPPVAAPTHAGVASSVMTPPVAAAYPSVAAPAHADAASPMTAPQGAATSSLREAPPVVSPARVRGGTLSAQIIELAAAELAGQIRESLQPSQWQAVVERVGELLAE
ncbi:UvrD-helicase domain-containing protein [Actinoplanes sp. LDG1-06]|uniref:UvrD-helicase domain-containing protein n=1 Tax=Paractinoplanes ovalisporus TaxID=2810368 RepID=A0ABS2AM49_9ACTN|nr:UvrD-helicase domain-containing protein [Actinoplanes ovalisporus]MBM2620284.1 UvrD-helicase domain-containing protein [Actinoplanes ovalisporus]